MYEYILGVIIYACSYMCHTYLYSYMLFIYVTTMCEPIYVFTYMWFIYVGHMSVLIYVPSYMCIHICALITVLKNTYMCTHTIVLLYQNIWKSLALKHIKIYIKRHKQVRYMNRYILPKWTMYVCHDSSKSGSESESSDSVNKEMTALEPALPLLLLLAALATFLPSRTW